MKGNGEFGMAEPKTNLVLAVLSTFFCCVPFGIVSMIYALKVDSYWNAGRYQKAYEASNAAKNWALASIMVYVIGIVAYLFLLLLGVVTSANLLF